MNVNVSVKVTYETYSKRQNNSNLVILCNKFL